MDEKLLETLRTILESADERKTKAEKAAEALRLLRNYRRVGIYDVSEKEIAAVAWSGLGEPAFPNFSHNERFKRRGGRFAPNSCFKRCHSNSRYLTAFKSTQVASCQL